jgi:hypothetical protein
MPVYFFAFGLAYNDTTTVKTIALFPFFARGNMAEKFRTASGAGA